MVHAPLYLFIVNATVNGRVVSQNPQIYFKMITSNIMYLNVDTKMHKSCCSKYSAIVSGVSRISFRGGVQNFFVKVGVCAWREAPCSAWQSHAFARGVRGHASPRKFLKMVRFGEYFAKI